MKSSQRKDIEQKFVELKTIVGNRVTIIFVPDGGFYYEKKRTNYNIFK